MSGRSQIVTSPSCRTIFWSSSGPLRTYSLVCASRRRSHWKPAAVSPVCFRPRSMIIPHTARIVPLASGTMRAVWGMIIERGLKQTGDTAAGFQWLRRLDAQTKEYVLNGPLLDQKIVRQEGLVTIWDLPDILLNRREGLQLGYRFPRSGTPAIEDAIGVVRNARHRAPAEAFVEYVGGVEGQVVATREAYRLPARLDLPADSLPPWARDVRRQMKVAEVDWDLLAAREAEWMRYWDENVRGRGDGGRGKGP